MDGLKNYIKCNSDYYKDKKFIINQNEIDINYFNIPTFVEKFINSYGYFWSSAYQKFIKS